MSSPHSLQPPPPRPPAGPIGGAQGLWGEFLRHGKRWLVSDFTRMSATHEERAALLTAAPPVADPVVQDYVAWRRSMVWIGAILAAVGTVHALIAFLAAETGPETIDPNIGIGTSGFAAFMQFLVLASRGVLLLVLILAARRWMRPENDRLLLRWGWAIALFVPVVLMLLPLGDLVMLESEQFRAVMRENPDAAAKVSSMFGILFAVEAVLAAIPGLTSVFPGLIRAGFIVKTLLPGRSAGPIVSLSLIPVYTLVLLVLMTVLQQIGNNALFLIGAILILVGPLVSLRAGWSLVPTMSRAEASSRLARFRKMSRWPLAVGMLLLVIAFFTSKFFGVRMLGFGNVIVEVHEALLLVLWFFAMLTAYTVVSADFLIQAMRTADTMREKSESSSDFRRDTQTLVQLDITLAMPATVAGPPAPTAAG